MKILLVEDDRKVAGFIEQGLKEEGYVVDIAPDGDEATMLAHVYEYDVILLDVVLPKKNGFQVAAELRREGRNTPILMLTSRDAVEDVVRGLDAGADDYLSKPFQFDELLARIRALQRRGGAERLEVLRYGPITLDRLRHVAAVNDTPLDLTPKEFQLLEYFLLHPEEVVRRTTLLEKVWDMHFDPESNVVDVHVGNLRRKLMQAAGEPLIADRTRRRLQPARGARSSGDLSQHADPPGAALLPAGALLCIVLGLAPRLRSPDVAGPPVWTVGLPSPACRSSGARSAACFRPLRRRSRRDARHRHGAPAGEPLAGPHRRPDADRRRSARALRRGSRLRRRSASWRRRPRASRTSCVRAGASRGRRGRRGGRRATSSWCARASWCPATALVVAGHSHVDTARLTGEPMPVSAEAGYRGS